MEWFLIAAGVMLLDMLAFALIIQSARGEVLDAHAHRLALLGRVRSPTGKRFYGTREAPLELSADLVELTAQSQSRGR